MAQDDDGLISIPIPALSGGISQQPEHLRFPNQVADAENVDFSVRDGMGKRPGTKFDRLITGLTTGHGYRLHAIDRDGSERYVVLVGNPSGTVIVRAFEVGDIEATVTIHADAQTYLNLNNPTPDQLRLVSIADATFIINTTVPVAMIASPSYNVTASHRDYDTMVATTPADESYHQAREDTEIWPAGYWQYDVGGVTFGKVRFADLADFGSGGWFDLAAWQQDGANPGGLTIFFQRIADGGAGYSFNNGTKKLTKVGGFANLFADGGAFGDQVKITGGTGVVADSYPIAAVNSADEITLFDDIGGTNPSDVIVDGIGVEVEIAWDMRTRELRDLHDVAAEIQAAFARAGQPDVLVSWETSGTGNGYFVVTGPFRGSGARVHFPTPPTQSLDFTDQHTDPFYSIGITAISVGNPTQITTDRAHDLENGDVVTIFDTDSTPPLSGQYTVTKVDATKFTVPVNVTVAGTTGRVLGPGVVRTNGTGTVDADNPSRLPVDERWIQKPAPAQADARPDPATMPVKMVRTSEGSPSVFNIDPIDWTSRLSGNAATNPLPRLFREGERIRDAAIIRDRLWLVGGEFACASADGDYFNFFQFNFLNLIDSDPIDLSLSSDQVTIIDFVVPYRRAAWLFTQADRQFELAAPEALTPSTAAITEATQHDTLPVRPQAVGNLLYFLVHESGRTGLVEVNTDFIDQWPEGQTVSEHADELLPADVTRLLVHPNSRKVIVVPEDGSGLYVYQPHFDAARRKVQSAWTAYAFDDGYRVSDGCIIGDDLWMLVEHKGQYALETLPLAREAPPAGWPFVVHLDRRIALTGVHAAGTTTWTLPGGLDDETLDTIVRGPDFGVVTGVPVPTITNNGTTITATGNYSAGPCIVGRSFGMSATLTRPFERDERGNPELARGLLSHRLAVAYRGSGTFSVVADYTGGAASVETERSVTLGTLASGILDAMVRGDVEDMTVTIESDDPRPVRIGGMQYTAEPVEKLR